MTGAAPGVVDAKESVARLSRLKSVLKTSSQQAQNKQKSHKGSENSTQIGAKRADFIASTTSATVLNSPPVPTYVESLGSLFQAC